MLLLVLSANYYVCHVCFCNGYFGDGKITIFKQDNHILDSHITKQELSSIAEFVQ
jgi:hypothetical protein